LRNPQGYSWNRDRVTGKETGNDTITCGHCNCVCDVEAGKQPTSFCSTCTSYICQQPDCHRGCAPFMKKIEAQEKRFLRRQNFMKAAGID
jgi:hypothetical protein